MAEIIIATDRVTDPDYASVDYWFVNPTCGPQRVDPKLIDNAWGLRTGHSWLLWSFLFEWDMMVPTYSTQRALQRFGVLPR